MSYLIVVALDGSELSQAAVPYAVALARATQSRLLLATAGEEPNGDLQSALPEVRRVIHRAGHEVVPGVPRRSSRPRQAGRGRG